MQGRFLFFFFFGGGEVVTITYINEYIYIYIQTYMHACIHTCIHTSVLAWYQNTSKHLHTYVCVFIHIYIYIYIHAHIMCVRAVLIYDFGVGPIEPCTSFSLPRRWALPAQSAVQAPRRSVREVLQARVQGQGLGFRV